MEFDPKALWFLGSVPVIIVLVNILKAWFSDTRLYPVFAIVSGIILNIAIGRVIGQPMLLSGLAGFLAGLVAGGGYSWVSTIQEGVQANKVNRTTAGPSAPSSPSIPSTPSGPTLS